MNEVPIELYKTENNEFIKYVRYEEYEKLKQIISEQQEQIEIYENQLLCLKRGEIDEQ